MGGVALALAVYIVLGVVLLVLFKPGRAGTILLDALARHGPSWRFSPYSSRPSRQDIDAS